MDELTQQKADLKASIADREIARGFHLQKSHIAFYLRSLRDADWSDKEAQKRLIQTFVNAVFVYDDHITLTYNFSGDKSTITLHDMQRFEDGEEFGCRASRSTKQTRPDFTVWAAFFCIFSDFQGTPNLLPYHICNHFAALATQKAVVSRVMRKFVFGHW